MTKYTELLLSPEWKSKRNIILKRDDYKCTVCGSKVNLVVHHTFYWTPFKPPWYYPNSSLLTVCEDCHTEYHIHCEVEIRKYIAPKRNKPIKPKQSNIYTAEIVNGKRIRKVTIRSKDINTAKIKLINQGNWVVNIKQAKKYSKC